MSSVKASVDHDANVHCSCCNSAHPLWRCPKFKKLTSYERYELVKTNRLCFNCLLSSHRISNCQSDLTCRHCKGRHNSLLHFEKSGKGVEAAKPAENAVVACNSCIPSGKGKKLHKIVPVKVWTTDPAKAIECWAYMDDGSELSLCTTEFAKKIGAQLEDVNLTMLTNNAETSVKKRIDSIHVQGLEETAMFEVIGTMVQDQIVDVSSSIPSKEITELYPHLSDLNFPKLKSQSVELLLGQNVQSAFCVSELRYGQPNDPHGLHLGLGWALWGMDHLSKKESNNAEAYNINFIQEKEQTNSCQEILQTLSRDFDDIDLPQVPCLSKEDTKALNIFEESVSQEDDHYKVGLPWKEEDVHLPNNKFVAEKRLFSLKKKLLADQDLCDKYCSKMSEYLDKGYASLIPEGMLAGSDRTWYVPHHCTSVLTKFRIVFDCSAKCDGICLNDKLLQGPDLANNMIGIILRFRQEPIAVVGDIKAMFHQVLVKEEDRDSFRFLWFPDNDLSKAPVAYRMNVHIFGCTSSPSVAAFALRKTALDNKTGADEETVSTVLNNFYIDDLCKSCPSEEDSIRLISQITKLLHSGGFQLTKFLSNSKRVLDSVLQEDRAASVMDNVDHDLPTQKALGLYWDAQNDKFRIKVNVQPKKCTRRNMLAIIHKTYDPLGIIQPFLLPARRLLQEACAKGLDWDEPMSSEDWETWFNSLPNLQSISFDRSFKRLNCAISTMELHVFCDAAERGYGACAYLRVEYCDNTVCCNFVCGKSRVAPLKPLTIPRLELTAAVVAAKLGNTICREMQCSFSRVVYWSDAIVVLRYLNNTSSRYKTFVANRINIVHSMTSVSQWRYVPTSLNPADIASRGVSPDKVADADLWFTGPKFLLNCVNEWPQQPDFLCEADADPEERKIKMCSTKAEELETDPLERVDQALLELYCFTKNCGADVAIFGHP